MFTASAIRIDKADVPALQKALHGTQRLASVDILALTTATQTIGYFTRTNEWLHTEMGTLEQSQSSGADTGAFAPSGIKLDKQMPLALQKAINGTHRGIVENLLSLGSTILRIAYLARVSEWCQFNLGELENTSAGLGAGAGAGVS